MHGRCVQFPACRARSRIPDWGSPRLISALRAHSTMSLSLQKRMQDDVRDRFSGPLAHREVSYSLRNGTPCPDQSRSGRRQESQSVPATEASLSLPPIDATFPVGHHARSTSPTPGSPVHVSPVQSRTSLPMLPAPLRPAPGAGRLRPSGGHSFQIAMFSAKEYDRSAFDKEVAWLNKNGKRAEHTAVPHIPINVKIVYIEEALGEHSLALLPPGTQAVCGFVNDKVTGEVIKHMAAKGVRPFFVPFRYRSWQSQPIQY